MCPRKKFETENDNETEIPYSMKLGIISTIKGYSWAGTEEVWYHLATAALDQGHELMLGADQAVAQSEQVQSLQRRGMLISERRPFRPTRLYHWKQNWLPDMKPLADWGPDVVLINAGSPLDLQFSPTIRTFVESLTCPMVFFCHFNSDRLESTQWDRVAETLQKMKAIVFVNQQNRRDLERQLGRSLPPSYVLLNASRDSLPAPLPMPSRDNGIYLANVARLETKWKGQDLLLEVLADPIWKSRHWQLNFFGSGPDQEKIQRLIQFYGLEERAVLAGYCRNLETIWSRHHLLALPSRGEGTPLVAVEAMMHGRPVVTTDVGGNREIIESGMQGFIAEAPTAYSFHRALEAAWETQESWENIGAAAHRRATELGASKPDIRLLEILKEISSQ